MKLKYLLLSLIGLALITSHPSAAQTDTQKLQLKARVGYSIGGTAPLGLPATIRSIESFRLTPNFMVGVDGMYRLSEKFGLQAALHYEIKDMDGEVTTKGYHMKVKMDEDELEGLYTGHVSQIVRQRMITIPVHFSDDMRSCQMGVAVGIDWAFYRRLGLSADLSWGLTGIHRGDFKTVEQTLFPIYGTIGFFYRFY